MSSWFSVARKAFLVWGVLVSALLVHAAEEEGKNPKVILRTPLALMPGKTNDLKLRGLLLTNLQNLSVTQPAVVISHTNRSAKPPEGLDAKRAGDTLVELRLFVPPSAEFTNVAVTLAFSNHPPVIVTVPLSSQAMEEKEPNGGFKTAMTISPGAMVIGRIDPKKDIDVFSMEGTGVEVTFEVEAARSGSALDAMLSIVDEAGHVMADNDDSFERDPFLKVTVPAGARWFLVLQDAHDKGGEAHPYILRFRPSL